MQVTTQKKPISQIPDSILCNPSLNKAISLLPSNYNFEVHKTVWRILNEKANCSSTMIVGLQFPEGLVQYSFILCDIFSFFCGVDTIIFGDANYGACCVDDISAKSLNVNLLIHYGMIIIRAQLLSSYHSVHGAYNVCIC